MNKFKSLAKNTAIFGISQFTSKVMVFLLLPLYTATMTTSDYGSADLVVSTIGLLLPIFTMEISSAVLRFSIEKKEDSKSFFLVGLSVIVCGFLLLLLTVPIFKFYKIFEGYLSLFYLLFLANSIYTLLSYYARGTEKIKWVGIAGIVNTAVLIISNIVLLIVFHKGIKGYLISYILGYTISAVLLIIVLIRYLWPFSFKINKRASRDMIKYSVPLVPNNISWWGVTSANKYVINVFLSSEVLGLYSVALKIPMIINTVQAIFSEALVLSVLEEYNQEEKDEEYFSLIYRFYSFAAVILTSLIILSTKMISVVFFAEQFRNAWRYVPFLCIPPVWGSLSGYLGTFYSATKKTSGIFFSTLLGNCVTVGISLLTVGRFGIKGIIIGNIVAYFCIWLYRYIDTKKFVNLKAKLVTDAITWLILLLQATLVLLVENTILMYAANAALFLVIILLNKDVLIKILSMLCRFYNKRKCK